jgi:hypothetical protein
MEFWGLVLVALGLVRYRQADPRPTTQRKPAARAYAKRPRVAGCKHSGCIGTRLPRGAETACDGQFLADAITARQELVIRRWHHTACASSRRPRGVWRAPPEPGGVRDGSSP